MPDPERSEIRRRRRGPLRETLELFTLGLLLALVIREFAFDAFRVPSSSMEPTILGDESHGDQILVGRIGFQLRDPRRWEVVVFRYPLNRAVHYVKRIAGLPGELIIIRRGDVFLQSSEDAAPRVARKPRALQDAIFRANPALPGAVIDLSDVELVERHWKLPEGVLLEPGLLRVDARGEPLEIPLRPDVIPSNARHDSAASAGGDGARSGVAQPVGDLRVELAVTPGDDAASIVLRLRDCSEPTRPLELEVAVRGSARRSALRFGGAEIAEPALSTLSIPPGRESILTLENADDLFRVLVDGEEILRRTYRQDPEADLRGASQVAFGLTGGRAAVRRVGIYRDLHYTLQHPYPLSRFRVPADHYLMLGDNSPGSQDSRSWRAVGIRFEDRVLVGSLEGTTDSLELRHMDNNPWPDPDDGNVHHFVDLFGNEWDLEAGSYDILDLPRLGTGDGDDLLRLHGSPLPDPPPAVIAYRAPGARDLELLCSRRQALAAFSLPAPYVARQAITGRAGIVFLPFGRQGVIR